MHTRFTFLFLLFLLCTHLLPAQNAAIVQESLETLKTSQDSFKIIDALTELAWQWRYSDVHAAERMALRALQSAKDSEYQKGEGDANMRLGVIMKNRRKYEEAITYYEDALAIRKAIPATNAAIASVHNTIGTVYRGQDKYNEAIREYQQGLDVLNGSIVSIRGSLLNNLSITNRILLKYDLALQYADSSIAVRNHLEEYDKVADVLLSTALIYTDLKNYERATKNLKTADSIYTLKNITRGLLKCAINFGKIAFFQKDFVRAIDNYEKALAYESVRTDLDGADLLMNLGSSYQQLGNTEKALQYFDQSYKIAEGAKDTSRQATVSYSIGETYRDNRQHNEAIKYLKQSINLLPDTPATSIHLEAYYSLYKSLGTIGKFNESLKYSEKYHNLRNTSLKALVETNNYKLNLEATQSELKIKKIENMKQTQLIYLLSGIIVMVFSFGIAMLAYYRQRQKRKSMEYEIDDLLHDHEVKTHYARLEGQDEERKRIAQDLHDRLGSMLSTIKLYFSALDSKVDLIRLENKEQYVKANTLLDEACEEVRNVAHNMQSGILTKFGLAAQIKDLAETITNSNQMEVEVITHKMDERLDSLLEVKVYRIVQEVVGNALKHSKAQKLTIHLNHFDEVVNLIIEDNGVGFEEGAVKRKKGMGLSNIRARVKALDGKFHIDSLPNRGTTISVDIPLVSEAALTPAL